MTEPTDPNPAWTPPPSPPYQPSPPFAPPPQYPLYGGDLWTYPAPPPRRTRWWIWAVAAVAVAIVVAIAASVAVRHDTSDDAPGTDGRTLTLPASVDNYDELRTIDTSRLLRQYSGSLGGDLTPNDLKNMQIATYGRRTTPEVVFVGFPADRIPKIAEELEHNGVESSLNDFIHGLSSAAGGTPEMSTAEPGPLGGFMRCGPLSLPGLEVDACVWADRSALALTMVVPSGSLPRTVRLTRDLRAAAEH